MAAATRTQIYLSAQQRSRLDELSRRKGKPLAALIREAVDAYLGHERVDAAEALDATFGSMPDLQVPSRDEWDRG
jgi:predicted DNA-binding protein